jgi:hypothetical protein
MKNTYKIILMGLVVLGIVYTNAEPDWKKTEEEKYKSIDICKFPVSIDIGHYMQLKECHKRKIELKQVQCEDIGQPNNKFPCYKGSDTFEVRANFPAIFTASIDTSSDDKDMIQEVNLYFENGVNTIQGNGQWEELTLCLEAWGVKIWKSAGVIGDVEIGDITIQVRPPDDIKDDNENDTEDETKNAEEPES